MKRSNLLIWLSTLVAVMAFISTATGLLYRDSGLPFPFTNVHGQTIEMSGNGLYRNDSLASASITRGTDAVILFVAIPILVFATLRYRRGSLRGRLFLVSILGCFLYNAFHAAFSLAYNNLFLVYLVYFSASLFSFILAFASIDFQILSTVISPRLPRRGIAIFLSLSGLTFFIWLIDIIGPLMTNTVPNALGPYTTTVTYSIDLSVLLPTVYLAAILLLRRAPLGYILASCMLVLNALIGLIVVGQTGVLLLSGVTMTLGEIATFVAPFVLTSLIASWLTLTFFRSINQPSPAQIGSENQKAVQLTQAGPM